MINELTVLFGQISDFIETQNKWVIQLAAVWLMTWLANVLLQKLLRKTNTSPSASLHRWRKAFIAALSLPLRVFIWVGGLAIALNILNENVPLPIIKTILGFQPVIHILIIGWFLLRFTHRSTHVAANKYPQISAAQIDTFQKIFTAIIATATIMLVLPNFGISIGGLLAFGGVGGIVIGLAAKDMLSNLMAAIMIYFDRPFAVGEWVALPEKNIEGTVEHIGWRQVMVRTFDKRLLFIPNSMFANLILVNPSKMTHRRIYESIGIRYQDMDKAPVIIEAIRATLMANTDLDVSAGVIVHLEKFSAYSVDIFISAFTLQTELADFLHVKEKVLFAINRIIIQHGADIAFPTQVLQIDRPDALIEAF